MDKIRTVTAQPWRPQSPAPTPAPSPGSPAQKMIASIRQEKENIVALQQLWEHLFSQFPPIPNSTQCSLWLSRHGLEIVAYGLRAASARLNRIESEPDAEPWSREEIIRYASKCMIRGRTFPDGEPLPTDWDDMAADAKRKLIALHKRSY
jgi:hypothetical protein